MKTKKVMATVLSAVTPTQDVGNVISVTSSAFTVVAMPPAMDNAVTADNTVAISVFV